MNVAAYIERIAYDGPCEPTLDTLRRLHRAHLLAVPFENLDIHLGRPILLDEDRLFEKIVLNRRGGFCYECNGLFGLLLRELGFHVTLLSARVRMSDGSGGFGSEFDHLVLRVDLDESWLADVGYGGGFREPLRLVEDVEQVQDWSAYRLLRGGDIWRYESRSHSGDPSDQWQPEYILTLQPRRFEDFSEMCHWQQTSPESAFTRKRLCSLATTQGRITLRDNRLIITENGQRTEQPVEDEAAWNTALQTYFGITLSQRGVSNATTL